MFCQHSRPVAITTGNIQHNLIGSQLAGQQVSMQVLQRPVAVKFRQIALSCAFPIIPSKGYC